MSLLFHLSREHVTARDLEQIYAALADHPDFTSELIRALNQLDPDHLYRAVTLLRKTAEKSKLSDLELVQIVDRLDDSAPWLYRLTFCQLFSDVTCPRQSRDQLFPFLQHCFADRRVIVRASALTAMMRFQNDASYRPAILDALRIAKRDPAKSMQARLRQLSRRTNPRNLD